MYGFNCIHANDLSGFPQKTRALRAKLKINLNCAWKAVQSQQALSTWIHLQDQSIIGQQQDPVKNGTNQYTARKGGD
jgi:hypothetical protein